MGVRLAGQGTRVEMFAAGGDVGVAAGGVVDSGENVLTVFDCLDKFWLRLAGSTIILNCQGRLVCTGMP